jgi:hypothetical protein
MILALMIMFQMSMSKTCSWSVKAIGFMETLEGMILGHILDLRCKSPPVSDPKLKKMSSGI